MECFGLTSNVNLFPSNDKCFRFTSPSTGLASPPCPRSTPKRGWPDLKLKRFVCGLNWYLHQYIRTDICNPKERVTIDQISMCSGPQLPELNRYLQVIEYSLPPPAEPLLVDLTVRQFVASVCPSTYNLTIACHILILSNHYQVEAQTADHLITWPSTSTSAHLIT